MGRFGGGRVSERELDFNTSRQNRLFAVQKQIARACRDSGRPVDDVELICVSKTFDANEIRPLLSCGHRLFGENRVQEAQEKWPSLREEFSDIKLHLIGPLQSNKAAEAVAVFDVIETLDRPKIAEAIAREMRAQNKSVQLFIQVNTGAEPQKAGVAPEELSEFLRYCRGPLGLSIQGLMCIPPVDEQASPHFALLRRLAMENGVSCLSMGMSGDFELAIQLGATHVRVGSAIFGRRNGKEAMPTEI